MYFNKLTFQFISFGIRDLKHMFYCMVNRGLMYDPYCILQQKIVHPVFVFAQQ